MDYTLSQYRPETFEVLAYNLTIEKLVTNFGYPKVRHASHGAHISHIWQYGLHAAAVAC